MRNTDTDTEINIEINTDGFIVRMTKAEAESVRYIDNDTEG